MSLRILVVDDDDGIRESVIDFLEGEGHTAYSALHGQAAFDQLDKLEDAPDLILLDLMMPVMDGYAFREAQRIHERYASVPVVVMSADPQLDDRRDELGARGYLSKPFDIKHLRAAIAA